MSYTRILNLNSLLRRKSHFLFGARSTGKTTLIEEQLAKADGRVMVFDLLDDETYQQLIRRPKVIEERIKTETRIIVIDEIQRISKLLNEVHRLLRKTGIRFLLTGSSARKLRHGGSNLLGGRAWEAHLYPLCSQEIPSFNLLKYLNVGGLPHVYPSANPRQELKHYTNLYLREEIVAEALVRKLDDFVRFLDVIALNNGEELHYQGLSNDSGAGAKTIQNYVGILQDTLIGFTVPAFTKTKKRKAIERAKFYMFDIGVTNILAGRGEILEKSELYGKALEHFIAREIKTYLSYRALSEELMYWRSTSRMEVDFVVGNKLAVEVKATSMVQPGHLKGLKTLKEEGLIRDYIVVSNDPEERRVEGIRILPIPKFLSLLWNDRLF